MPPAPPAAARADTPAGYRFGRFTLEPAERRLARDGAEVALTAKQLDTLLVLVANAGRLVTREELIAAVWPDTIVEEGNLTWAISHLRRTLGDAPSDPIATVRGHGYRFVWPVETLYDAAPEVVTRPLSSTPPPPLAAAEPSTSARPRAARSRWLLGAAAAVAALGGVLAVAHAPASDAALASAPRARRLAVLAFQDAGGRAETAWLAPALAELVSAGLAQSDRLEVASREEVARATIELGLRPAESYSPESLIRLGRSLTVEYVVAGGTVAVPGEPERVQLSVRLQRVATGRTIATVARAGPAADLIELAATAADGLRDALGASTPAARDARAAALLPAGAEARRAFIEGGEALRRSELREARARYERTAALAPDFALGWHGLARVLARQGEEARARPAAERAFLLSAGLPEADRLRVEANHRRLQRDPPAAVAALERLTATDPRNVDDALELAMALADAGRAREAHERLTALRAAAPAAARDARVDLQLAALDDRLGRSAAAIAAARRGRAAARDQGSPRLELSNLLAEAFALAGASPPGPSRGWPCSPAPGRCCARASDPLLEVRLEWAHGNLENAAGPADWSRRERAQAHWRRALERARAVGMSGAELSLLRNLGLVGSALGDLAGAEAVLREGRDRATALDSQDGRARFGMQLSQVLRLRGELAEARLLATEAAALLRRGGQLAARERVALRARRPRSRRGSARSRPPRPSTTSPGASARSTGPRARSGPRWTRPGRSRTFRLRRPVFRSASGARWPRRTSRETSPSRRTRGALLASALRRSGALLEAEREARRGLELMPPPRRPAGVMRVAQAHAEALVALGRDRDAAAAAHRRGRGRATERSARLGELEGRFLLARRRPACRGPLRGAGPSRGPRGRGRDDRLPEACCAGSKRARRASRSAHRRRRGPRGLSPARRRGWRRRGWRARRGRRERGGRRPGRRARPRSTGRRPASRRGWPACRACAAARS